MSLVGDLESFVEKSYRSFGPPKAMGGGADTVHEPHFFLLRKFLGEQDLAVLFNSKRCRYSCDFCALPHKSSAKPVSGEDLRSQFRFVIHEVRHALGLIDRLTIANEGSVFDPATFPLDSLLEIAASARKLPNVRRVVFESRLEFVNDENLLASRAACQKTINVLTGFETLNEQVRDEVLGKQEPIDTFLHGLDVLEAAGAELTAYVLFKPVPTMSDDEAIQEARDSIAYLVAESAKRSIDLTIRLNPMYAARGTPWRKAAENASELYQPPRLSDVLGLARESADAGAKIYIGLTSEGLADESYTYRAREDFASSLLRQAILHNTGQLSLSSIE